MFVVGAPGGIGASVLRVVAPHVMDIVALDKEDLPDLPLPRRLDHRIPWVHIAHSVVGHYVAGVCDGSGQLLFDQRVADIFERQEHLLGVEVVRSGDDGDIGPSFFK